MRPIRIAPSARGAATYLTISCIQLSSRTGTGWFPVRHLLALQLYPLCCPNTYLYSSMWHPVHASNLVISGAHGCRCFANPAANYWTCMARPEGHSASRHCCGLHHFFETDDFRDGWVGGDLRRGASRTGTTTRDSRYVYRGFLSPSFDGSAHAQSQTCLQFDILPSPKRSYSVLALSIHVHSRILILLDMRFVLSPGARCARTTNLCPQGPRRRCATG